MKKKKKERNRIKSTVRLPEGKHRKLSDLFLIINITIPALNNPDWREKCRD